MIEESFGIDKMKFLIKEVNEIMSPFHIYAVGGCVRDYIMGVEPKDYDFCTQAKPDEIEARIKKSGRHAYLTGKRFGTIACKINGVMIEITTFRGESYQEGNRKPQVEYLDNLNADLDRRDFTINSMAMKLKDDKLLIIDNHGGQEDIKNGIIRCVGNPKIRFTEDPLRILRAVRFASRYCFKYEEKTQDRMQKMAVKLLEISKERWMSEFDKILININAIYGVRDLFNLEIFRYTIPELQLQLDYDQNSKYHDFALNDHTIMVLAMTPQDINLRWAALLHDIAKPFVRTENKNGYCNYINHEILGAEMVERIARHLKWSNERREAVVELVRNHLKEDCPLKQYDDISKKVN